MSKSPSQSTSTKVSNAIGQFALETLSAWLVEARTRGWLRLDPRDGARVWPEELHYALDLGDELTAIGTLTPSDSDRTGDLWAHCWQHLEAALSEGDPLAERWWSLSHRLRLPEESMRLLALLVARAASTPLSRAFRYAWADFGRRTMPLGFASLLLAVNSPEGGDVSELLDGRGPRAAEPLRHCGLVELSDAELPGASAAEVGLRVPSDVVAWLCGWPEPLPELLEGDRLPAASTRLKAALAPRIRQLAAQSQGDATHVVVCGPEGSGRLGIAAELAVAWGKRGLWLLDLRRAEFSSNPEAAIARAVRMSALLDLAWAVVGAESARDPLDTKRSGHILQQLQEAADTAAIPSVWIVSDSQTLPGLSPGMTVQVPFPNRAQRVEAWRSELGDRLENDALDALAGQFLIAEGAIARAAQEVHSTLSIDSEPAAIRTAAADAARRFAAVGLGALAQPETSAVRLSDVILDRESRTLIEEIASYARHRHRLADEWGFGASMSYGLGVTALFAGPPGTGKTLAATAIGCRALLGTEVTRSESPRVPTRDRPRARPRALPRRPLADGLEIHRRDRKTLGHRLRRGRARRGDAALRRGGLALWQANPGQEQRRPVRKSRG